jgi:hypothetical protein
VNTGLATALYQAQRTDEPFFYAVSSDGQLLVPPSPTAINTKYVTAIPNVVGQFAPATTFLQDEALIKQISTMSNLYELPLEIQVVSNDGVGRFGIPFFQYRSPRSLHKDDLHRIVTGYFPQVLVHQKSLSSATHKQMLFDQSETLVREVFLGQATYLPWGREPFGAN